MTYNNGQIGNHKGNRGVALIMALLLLSVFMVMTLSMVIATSSDTLIDGYYRAARGSFYAAASGINAARAALMNDIVNNDLPTGYSPTNGSPVVTIQSSLPSNVTSTSSGFGSYQSLLGSSSSSSSTSWPGTFKIDPTNSSLVMSCLPTPQCSNGSTTPITTNVTYYYYYTYKLTADGQSTGGEINVVTEVGTITYAVQMQPHAGPPVNLAAYATLLDQYALCSAPFVPGTMTGKMFSNQSWNFGSFTTRYIFTGDVGAVNADVGYMYNDGTCDASASTTDSHRGVTIDPTFSGGLTLGANAVPLPANSYNQLTAVLDGLGDCPPAPATCNAPSQSQMSVLTNAAGVSWPSSGGTPSSGVFMPYNATTHTLDSNSSPGVGVANAGGIYVQGNVDQMTLTASTSGTGSSTHNLQLISIKQGSTTTTVTLDLTGNTTTISDNQGHTTGALTGLPQDLNAPVGEGCLVYVNGNISSNTGSSTPTGLSGPSSGAAIQNGSALTVVSTGTIDITGSLVYSTEPVSLNASDTAVSPAPTNVLGIYSSGGNVELKPPSNISTMELDASIATIAAGGSYGITAVWNTINNVNIVGGRVQNMALNGSSIGARNIYYDQRFAGGFAPPWFPQSTVAGPTTDTAVPQPITYQPISWVNSSAQ
ncbi:MAG TPA: pilus assembly PilX N-terminal domain-containing protein [Candidatus Acidoferrales bacterium]|jgi:hypothetical protein|nr:pilus assembly PilX N-terminal domain-containing protein [Candidatus Acidoferrales bacterium]